MATYKHVIDICLNFFDKNIISLLNKKIHLVDSNQFSKDFSKHLTNGIKDGKTLKDSPEYLHAYDFVDKDALSIYYQSSLTKRLIMNENINLANEYKCLDSLIDFPNKQKFYMMIYDFIVSQSISTLQLSHLNVNVLFCRDQIWLMKRSSNKK